MGRAPCCDKANVKKGPWSPEEDVKLKSYIEKHGTGGNWIALPHKIGLRRCGKSCRLRWLNYLRPNIRHGGFSEEEDNIIFSLYVNIGSRWSIIASKLPGRTDNDIKNYWNTRLKKKFLGSQMCGEQLSLNCVKRSNIDCTSMRKQAQMSKEITMANSFLTSNDHTIKDHEQNQFWAMDFPYNLPSHYSSSFKDLLVKLDGQVSNGGQGQMVDRTSFMFQHPSSLSSSASSMEYTTPRGLIQAPIGNYNDHNETSFQVMQGRSGINYDEGLLYLDSMACGETNTSSWGYFTSLMALPPPSCSSDGYNHTMNPDILH